MDEVQSGMGRTGKLFAHEWAGITPDVMSSAKGIGGGFPLGAVFAKEKYAVALKPGTHGTTYGGNPLACAAGIAAMDIFVNEKMADRAAELAPYFESQVHNLKGLRHITDIRNLGMAAAIDVGNPDGKPGQRPWQISMECWKRGLYLRYSGDNVQLGPPFISEKSEIDTMCNILADVIPSVE